MDQSSRRRFSRVKTEVPGQISVLIPEDTFNPANLDCMICDLSERGAMVSCTLPEQLYAQLLQRVRHCRLSFPEEVGLPDRVIGKAVWIQPEPGGNFRVRIGLFFEEPPELVTTKLRQYVESMMTNRA